MTVSACEGYVGNDGRVVDEGRHPVQGAVVTLVRRLDVLSDTTDSSGHFRMGNVTAIDLFGRTRWLLTACKPGIGYAERSFQAGDTGAVELTLVPANPDSGHVDCTKP